MIHSDVTKAESWARLTDEFLNSPLMNVDGTKVLLCSAGKQVPVMASSALCLYVVYVNMYIFVCRQMLITAYCP